MADTDPAKIAAEITRMVTRGLTAGASLLTRRVKEQLSVPAPRAILTTKTGQSYVARTRATAGAPPRKLSGRLRASIAYEVDAGAGVARVGTNIKYAAPLEKGYYARAGMYFPTYTFTKSKGTWRATMRLVKRRSGKFIKPHPFLASTLAKYRNEIMTAMKDAMR